MCVHIRLAQGNENSLKHVCVMAFLRLHIQAIGVTRNGFLTFRRSFTKELSIRTFNLEYCVRFRLFIYAV